MNHPYTEELKLLIERLSKSYYEVVLDLCLKAKKHASRLKELEVQQATSQYVTLCFNLIEEVQEFIKVRIETLIPYVASLSEKIEEGHDCKNCSGTGSCSVQHELHLSELRQSLVQLKDIMNRIQMLALPLYSETIYPDVYRLLRNHIALIENALNELYSVEETKLIPKIIETQKNINARV